MKNYLFVLLCVCSSAQAEWPLDFSNADYRLQINGISRHFVDQSRRDLLNESNTGLRIEAQFRDDYYATAGWLEDSYFATAPYVGYGRRWTWLNGKYGYLQGGLLGFLTYRKYRLTDTSRTLVPGLLPTLTLGTSKIPGKPELNLTYIPEIEGYVEDAPVLFLQLSISISDF